MDIIKIELDSLVATKRLAKNLANRLPDRSVVALDGTLGAGKSQLVRFVAEELGVDPQDVTSPTFTLWHTYEGQRSIHHLDAYRLKSVDEFWELGAEELFEMPGLVFIEWANRIQSALPPDYWQLDLEVTGESTRSATLTGVGRFLTSQLGLEK